MVTIQAGTIQADWVRRRVDDSYVRGRQGFALGGEFARRTRVIITHSINLCWFCFKWGLLLALVVVLAASPFYYRRIFLRVEEEVRARVEAKIAEQLPHLEVHVRAAHLMGDGIEVRGLSITEPDAAGPQPELVYFDEMYLTCQTSVQDLLSAMPVVTRLKISRPKIRATRRPDGSFSVSRLLPLPNFDGPPPPIVIEGAMIEIFDPLKNPSSTFTLRDVNLTVQPSPDHSSSKPEDVVLAVEGYMTGDQIQRIELAGTVEPHSNRWTFSGTVDGLELSPEFLSTLPQPISERLVSLSCLRAPANFSFRIQGSDVEQVPTFEINGSLARGRLENPHLPYALADLRASVHCDNSGIRIRDLSAHHGATVFEVAQFDRQGFEPNSPFVLRASGRQVRFERGWGNTLDEPLRTDWKNYDPEGDVNFDCMIVSDGQTWQPTLHVTCLNNISFSCHRFPYRLEGIRGTLNLEANVLALDLMGFSGAQPVYVKGRFDNPGPNFSGVVDLWGEKIQFDEKLFGSLLKPKARETLRSLNPRGTFNFHAHLWREPNDPLPRPEMHEQVRVAVNRCSVHYEKFPYPLNNVQGELEMRDGMWTFPNLSGTNGTGTITCHGMLAITPREDTMELVLHGDNVPLETELRDALPRDRQELWSWLEPYGSINFDAVVRHQSGREPAVDLDVQPRGDGNSLRTSIQPVAFPYRMEILGGSMHYHDGHVELKDLHGVHRNTHVHTAGHGELLPQGGWRLQLDKFAVDRLRLQGEDPELIVALPKPLRRAIVELRPSGPINLKGGLTFEKRIASEPLRTAWDVDLLLNRASLQVGPKLENIYGCVWLKGACEDARFASHGQLKLDGLTYKNFQFTQVMGPFSFDNDNVYFGSTGRPPVDGTPAGRITALLFGGTVAADCQ
ncbi:MAG TPA: hypothetical protein VHV08_04215, partial [Pirellulales bacterium]|nr:hypothetical protein [Pirellulales bacterium]